MAKSWKSAGFLLPVKGTLLQNPPRETATDDFAPDS